MFGRKKLKKEEEKKEEAKVEAEDAASSGAGETSASSETSATSATSPSSDSSASGEAAAEPEKPAEPDWKALYALTLADFDNYKKRAARDRDETYRYAEADILGDVLPAVDNLALALDNASDKAEDPFVKGVRLVYETLLKSLKGHGAEPFDSVGKPLDTERMEAIATLPSPAVPEGVVSIESKKGWLLKGKVLRAAQVVVSAGKPAGATEEEAEGAKEEKSGNDGETAESNG